MHFGENTSHEPVSLRIFLDDAAEPIAVYKPPAVIKLDTALLSDGRHGLRIEAIDAIGNIGTRTIPFIVANGPGITVTGLRADARVRGEIEININAFGADEPFDPVRAESEGPIPVWTWVLIIVIAAWAGWYGLEFFQTPAAFAQTPTYAANPALAAAEAPATETNATQPSTPNKTAAGFDYAALGQSKYDQNCASCHGTAAQGVPGTFPPLAGDPVVTGKDADAHIKIVLHGLSGKAINGTKYAAQMPPFSQLSDAEIAAVVDHERTSWGNNAPTVTPGQVTKDR